jgi:uncharacterized protein (TIGR02246 family)
MNNQAIINQLVEAYNAGNARAFADLFAPNATHGNINSLERQNSREEIYQRYLEVFGQFPENRTEVLHRIVVGSFVVDHERVQRSPAHEPFEVVAVYTLEDGLITRLDFVR